MICKVCWVRYTSMDFTFFWPHASSCNLSRLPTSASQAFDLFKLVDSSEIMNEDALPMRRDESRDWWNSAARGLFHTTMKQHDLSCMTYRNWMDLPWILVIFFNIWRWNQTSNTDAKDLECFPEISVVLPQRGRIGRCFVFFSLCHFSFLQVSIDDVLGPKKHEASYSSRIDLRRPYPTHPEKFRRKRGNVCRSQHHRIQCANSSIRCGIPWYSIKLFLSNDISMI